MGIRTEWIVRAETDADIPAIREILLAAFDTAEEADLVGAVRRDPAWIDGLSMLTTEPDGTPVRQALLTRCHVGDIPALCLGPCARQLLDGIRSASFHDEREARRLLGEIYRVTDDLPLAAYYTIGAGDYKEARAVAAAFGDVYHDVTEPIRGQL